MRRQQLHPNLPFAGCGCRAAGEPVTYSDYVAGRGTGMVFFDKVGSILAQSRPDPARAQTRSY